jgi:hypothetical protein
VATEVTKRETVYADFAMSTSNWLVNAYTRDEIVLGGDEQRKRSLRPLWQSREMTLRSA